MGKHSDLSRAPSRQVRPSLPTLGEHRSRPLFLAAFVITVGVLLVNVVDPYSGAVASPYYQTAPRFAEETQAVQLAGSYQNTIARDAYSVTAKVVVAAAASSAPAAGTPDPGSAQAIALGVIASHGWGEDQYNCLVSLWNRESRWNVYAHNASSGAYGIPQSLPGEKMASAGADWQTNPATQITWGLGYIEGRYGSPCGAWAHSEDKGWY